ncbi:hypothetical protein LRS05_04040 [Flavobacterium sp. J372]|uniref:hypothetical protein n=1 Tax=Flavobacterium sp. J372 TaxID=2898436 RepID=UPI002150C618|nr:hypothetical protein [Flavobacterium sp. J372]MCR5861368.1 hypothetical protein [Flavobacterium sp. J372]
MKESEVPQDKGRFEALNMRELCYATDEDGNYKTALSAGWKPKEIALDTALEDIKERTEEARQAVAQGKLSPIAYYMELNKMDLPVLAGYVSMWQWRVKRHFKPAVFSRLNNKLLGKYAGAFNITVDELKNFKG